MFCCFKDLGGLTLCGEELIQSVDGHELNTGRVVDLLLTNFPEDFVHDPFGASVAVVVRVLEQLTAFSQQGVVHTPGINADPCQLHFFQRSEGLAHFEPESSYVPAQRSSIFDRLIGETMNLLGRENS